MQTQKKIENPQNDYDKELNIYQRLFRCQAQLEAIEKMKPKPGNDGLKFSFASHNDVTEASKEVFMANGILCIPDVLESIYNDYETIKAGYNGAEPTSRVDTECTIKIQLIFINIDKPEEKIVTHSSGQGLDSSDKAFGKAYSYAFKYALLKILMAKTEDSDSSQNVEKRQPMNFNTRAQGRDITPIAPMQDNKSPEQKNQEAVDRQVGFIKSAATIRRLDEVWSFSQKLFNGATAAQQENLSNAYIDKQQQLREEGK